VIPQLTFYINIISDNELFQRKVCGWKIEAFVQDEQAMSDTTKILSQPCVTFISNQCLTRSSFFFSPDHLQLMWTSGKTTATYSGY